MSTGVCGRSHPEGGLALIDAPLDVLPPKKKIFESVQPHFSIRSEDGVALFLEQHPFRVLGKGLVTVPSIRSGGIS